MRARPRRSRMSRARVISLVFCVAIAMAADELPSDLRIEALKARLEEQPDDQDARRQLLVLYVVDRDDPKSARRYSSQVDDEMWKDCVLLASRDVSELAEEDLLKAGNWYRG